MYISQIRKYENGIWSSTLANFSRKSCSYVHFRDIIQDRYGHVVWSGIYSYSPRDLGTVLRDFCSQLLNIMSQTCIWSTVNLRMYWKEGLTSIFFYLIRWQAKSDLQKRGQKRGIIIRGNVTKYMAEQKLFIKGAHHPTLHKLFCCSFIFYYAPFLSPFSPNDFGTKRHKIYGYKNWWI